MTRISSDRKHRTLRLAGAAAAGIAALSTSRQSTAAIIGNAPGRFDSALTLQNAPALDEFTFAYDGILGTSLDLIVQAPRRQDAVECEQAVLSEIERLRAILSTYDSFSEINRFKAGEPITATELHTL